MKVNKKFIDKINEGNRLAENELFDYTKSKIKAFLEYKYPTSSEDDTADIVIKIFEKINKFDSKKSKYKTWITNVAKNHMIDKSRVYANNVFFVSTTTVGVDALDFTCNNSGSQITYNLTSSSDFIKSYEDSDDVKALSSCIDSNDLSLLKMKYYGGYNYEEISKEVDMDKRKISNRVNYIKKKLKKGN